MVKIRVLCMSDIIEKLTNNRILIHRQNYDVVVHEGYEKPDVPIACDVCKTLLRNIDDELSYKEYKCCDQCSQDFARRDRERWDSGWRPAQDEIDVAISKRTPIFINIDSLC